MKPLNQTKTKEEVLEWMTRQKQILDKKLVDYVESIHLRLSDIEFRGKQRLSELSGCAKQ